MLKRLGKIPAQLVERFDTNKISAKPIEIVLWLLCLISFIYSFYVRDVLIDLKFPLLMAILAGLLAILFTKNSSYYLFAFLGYGSMVISIPLVINNIFADKNPVEFKLKIETKTHAYYKHGPYITTKYNNVEQVIEFPSSEQEEMFKSSYVIISAERGLLGYYIVKHAKLSRE